MHNAPAIEITPDLPYFAALADCDFECARRIARRLGLGPEHVDAIDSAESMAQDEAERNAQEDE